MVSRWWVGGVHRKRAGGGLKYGREGGGNYTKPWFIKYIAYFYASYKCLDILYHRCANKVYMYEVSDRKWVMENGFRP